MTAIPRPVAPDAPIQWAEVLDSFGDAVVVTDRSLRIVLFNHAAEELIGVPQGRALGLPCTAVFDEISDVDAMIERVRRSGQREARSDAWLLRRGERLPARITCLPVWDAAHALRGIVLVIRDRSQQHTLEETVRRNENLVRLGTLVTGVAHEVKNPLAGIKGAAQLLAARAEADASLQQYAGVIIKETNRLTALVEQLLQLGNPPAPQLAPVNIHQVIQHVLALMDGELTDRGIRVRYEFDPSLPEVSADEAQLSQVLLNLVTNAMEAMTAVGPRDGGHHLLIRTRMETDFHIVRESGSSQLLRIEVHDSGTGIEEEDPSRVFEPFFTTKARGTGLGLAISHRIVTDHGGTIRAAPSAEGGTVFIVSLPLS